MPTNNLIEQKEQHLEKAEKRIYDPVNLETRLLLSENFNKHLQLKFQMGRSGQK